MTTAAYKLLPPPTVEGGRLLSDHESTDFVLMSGAIEFDDGAEDPPPLPKHPLRSRRARLVWWAASDRWSGWLADC